MLSKQQQRTVADTAVALMQTFEDEVLAVVAEELALLSDLDEESINARQLAISLKVQELRRRYSEKYGEAVYKALAGGFTANAASELNHDDYQR